MLNMNDYVQELLANLVEEVVNMYELKNGAMSEEQGRELAEIRDRLAVLLKDFVESNQ